MRKKAGMPTNKMGTVLRSYTNQSETVNNKLTWQKEAISGKAKSKSNLTKLEFVREMCGSKFINSNSLSSN